MQVEDTREFGVFVVAQEPRASVKLGREDHRAVEGLEDQVIFPVVEAGGKADPVVLGEAFELRRQTAVEGLGPVVGGGPVVGHVHVDVGLGSFPEERGHMGFGLPEIEPVVEHDEVGRVFPASLHEADEGLLLFIAELSADGIHFEKPELVVAAEAGQQVDAGFFLLRSIAETIGPEPDAEASAEAFGLFGEGTETLGKLLLEFPRFGRAIIVGRIDGPGVEGVDVEGHAVFVAQPLEEREIGRRLRGHRSLVGIVDPGEVVRLGGGVFVGSGENLRRGRGHGG